MSEMSEAEKQEIRKKYFDQETIDLLKELGRI